MTLRKADPEDATYSSIDGGDRVTIFRRPHATFVSPRSSIGADIRSHNSWEQCSAPTAAPLPDLGLAQQLTGGRSCSSTSNYGSPSPKTGASDLNSPRPWFSE